MFSKRTETVKLEGREFQVWDYSASHRLLLLMSTMEMGYKSRVCILFAETREIRAPTTLEIEEIRFDPLSAAAPRIFQLLARRRQYSIEAASMFVDEDDGRYDSPTIFDRWLSNTDEAVMPSTRSY